ncbi:BON domain-containing protein [Pseudomonas sp. R5(2019)]|uniref:BON domain-containing protein n=1 Tax=Pseudomonas sp. R5(2019) TaxID=2697566 RepID=UPI001411FAE9|nr:BON domain-containing protein [Pseudomonas sp. R5(2019)]NBA96941.1 BON domain-containing protein [Pseudomonas sp. R5(2019)]
MQPLKSLAIATATASFLLLAPLSSYAAQGDLPSQLEEARQEGSIWASLAVNRHLSGYTISIDVEQGVARLEGEVETQVERDLAEQIALQTRGIERVDNQLKVNAGLADQPPAPRKFAQQFDDATLTATIKSKLLWNTRTEAMDIQVHTRNGVVTLKGRAKSPEAKELAGNLARNTQGVYEVNNLISISGEDSVASRTEDPATEATAVLSDAWITSKVKASLLYSRNLDGLTIKVDTKDGLVTLGGVVMSTEEKTLAIEIARNVRGVRGVDADLLKVAGKANQ